MLKEGTYLEGVQTGKLVSSDREKILRSNILTQKFFIIFVTVDAKNLMRSSLTI